MAGRARRQALADELERRAKEQADWQVGDDEPSILDYACSWIEDGKYLNALADECNAPYSLLMSVLVDRFGKTAVDEAMAESRARASHLMVEQSVQIVDAEADTQVEVSRASSRSRSRQWAAERWNRKAYGQDKGVNVAISIGGLHLDALRARPAATATLADPPPITSLPSDAKAEVVEAQQDSNAA